MDLVPEVTSAQRYDWDETCWTLGEGYGRREGRREIQGRRHRLRREAQYPAACSPTAAARSRSCRRRRSADDILALKPDGVFLSNGPGDPAETGHYAAPVIKALLDERMPIFGICLGHQMLGLARRREHDEDEAGPSRREPSGEGLHDRQGRDRLDEPRLCDRSRQPAAAMRRRRMSRCSTAPIAASRSPTGRPSPSSITPKPRPDRATATISSGVSSR